MRRTLMLIMALAGVATGATAATGAADMVSAADIPAVVAALDTAGYRPTIKKDDDGATYILAEEGGDEFSVSFDECEESIATTGCKILVFNTSWEDASNEDIDLANRFNQTATLAHAFVDADGMLNLAMVVTTEGGLPAANFSDVIARWQAADDALTAMIEAEAPAASGRIVASFSVP
jgi:hypothetical protein